MRYNAIPNQFTVTLPVGGVPTAFHAAERLLAARYAVGFGKQDEMQGASDAGRPVTRHGAVHCGNLYTCAAAMYFYTDVNDQVTNAALFHAHTGGINAANLPTDPQYNTLGTPLARIHVVFASAQSRVPNAGGQSILTAAAGVIAIAVAGVPEGNIRILTDIGGAYGCDDKGEIGAASSHRYYWRGDLRTMLGAAFTSALGEYENQFGTRTRLGRFGSDHNRADGISRIAALNAVNNHAATFDDGRIDALETFFANTSRSYKAGSLKLILLQKLYTRFHGHPTPAVTTANAAGKARALIDAIRAGTL